MTCLWSPRPTNTLRRRHRALTHTLGRKAWRSARGRRKVMTLNIPNPPPVQVNGYLPTTEEFTYLGSTVRHNVGAGSDVRNHLQEGQKCLQNAEHTAQSPSWSCTRAVYFLPCYTAQGVGGWMPVTFTSSLFSTQGAGEESWEFSGSAPCQMNNCLTIITRRRWRWTGPELRHMLRKEPGNITRKALHWTPEGKRKRGRPENTWRRTV